MSSYEVGYIIGYVTPWIILIALVLWAGRFLFDLFGFLKEDSKALKELKNILTFKSVYENESVDGFDVTLPLYYLRLHNGEREFNSSICLCKSELMALKIMYEVEFEYKTKKVYSLELRENDVKVLQEVETTLGEVYLDDELKANFNARFSDGITPYSKDDFRFIDDKCELIWDMDSREAQFLIKRKEIVLMPKSFTKGDAQMPFYFNGSVRVMTDESGKYGVIDSQKYFKKTDYKVVLDFKYHYIREDGFGNVEILETKPEHNGDYKKLICEMIKVGESESKKVLLNSTTKDEYITVDEKELLTLHSDTGISKPYTTIIKHFHDIKPVQCENGLWGYIDEDAKEMIPCRYEKWNFFVDGYTKIKIGSKEVLIDTQDNVIIDSADKIVHYEEDIFFVSKDEKWAVYKNGSVYIDFFDTKEKLESIKKEQSLDDEALLEYLRREYFMRTGYFFSDSVSADEVLLRFAIVDKKLQLQKQKYKLPLVEYVKLFDAFSTDKSLREAGLWEHKVKVKMCEILKSYVDILENPSEGEIYFSAQVGASIYDMQKELPVAFRKKDGSVTSVGIEFENLELVKG